MTRNSRHLTFPRLAILASSLALLASCDSIRQRNIAIYEQSLQEPPAKSERLPQEKNEDSFITRDELSDFEREVVNQENRDYQQKAKKRSNKIFGIISPKDK